MLNAEKILSDSVTLSRNSGEWFLENIIHQLDECDQWQVNLVESVLDVYRFINKIPTVINHNGLNRITVVSCHGTGKTHALALILHVWNYCFHGLVVGTAPKQDQIKTRFMPRYRKIRKSAPDWYSSLQTVDAMKVTILGDRDWGYFGETASEPDNMAGYHDTPQLILVDEASAKTLDPMFPVIEGALTTSGSVLVTIGNPTRTSGEFYNSHKKKGVKELYFKVHVKPKDSRYVSDKWLVSMATKYGKDSSIYKIRCLGEFVDAEENQLISLSWLEEAQGKELPEQGSFYRLRISIDVADGGLDDSVVTVSHIYETAVNLKKQYTFNFPSALSHKLLFNAVDKIATLFEYDIKRGDDIVVDTLGVGSGTAGLFINSGRYNVILYKGGESADDPKMYRCKRVQSYIGMRNDYRDGNVYIDDDFCSAEDWEDFTAQMCSIKTREDSEKLEDLEPKKFLLVSPDKADSNAMIYATSVPVLGNVEMPELVGTLQSNSHDMDTF